MTEFLKKEGQKKSEEDNKKKSIIRKLFKPTNNWDKGSNKQKFKNGYLSIMLTLNIFTKNLKLRGGKR